MIPEIGRLEVVRAAPDDAVERRVGLPLGMVVALLKDSRGTISLSVPVAGRLSDPKFDLHEVIWSALRTMTVKTVALPVSWIGKLRFTPDSRIADIDIDPVGFETGGVQLTPGAAARSRA